MEWEGILSQKGKDCQGGLMVHKITGIFHQGKAFFAKAGSAVEIFARCNDHSSTVPTSLRLLKQIYSREDFADF